MNKDRESSAIDSLIDLRNRLRAFAEERDWDQFHRPKNLAISLVVEAAELLENFQWTNSGDVKDPDQLHRVSEEMADVLLYLIRLADKLDVDLAEAAMRKIEVNAKKYPIEKAKGSSKKYTEF